MTYHVHPAKGTASINAPMFQVMRRTHGSRPKSFLARINLIRGLDVRDVPSPKDSVGYEYELECESQQSIARMAGLRDAVERYQASCVESYREVNLEDHHELDAWWTNVSGRRKQVITTAIAREKREAKVWLAKAERGLHRQQKGVPLPREGDGADSTNIQLHQYSGGKPDVAEGDCKDDQDGVDYAQESDREIPLHQRPDEKQNEDAKAAYLDEVKKKYGETFISSFDITASEAQPEFKQWNVKYLISGDDSLATSWRKVEDRIGSFYPRPKRDKLMEPEEFLRLEEPPVINPKRKPKRKRQKGVRTDYSEAVVWDWVPTTQEDRDAADAADEYCPRERYRPVTAGTTIKSDIGKIIAPKYAPLREELRRAWDAIFQEFRDVPYFTGDTAYERRIAEKRSPRKAGVLLDLNAMSPTKEIRRYVGPVREWNGKTSDHRYQEWKASGGYDALQAFREMTKAATAATEADLGQRRQRKDGRIFTRKIKVAHFAAA
jgi:hypothetical protein